MFILTTMLAMVSKPGDNSIIPVNLRCEYLKNPLGIDILFPRFSWVLSSSKRGEYQTAYQILVASNREKLDRNDGDKWDSGKVYSDESVNVAYEGEHLLSGETCYWKVRAWDKDGKPGPWSDTATFEMGLLEDDDWKGVWIGAKNNISAPLLRKEFTLDKEIKRARAYISGLGYYELYINGDKVGNNVLDPGTTYYNNDQPFELHARVLYVTHDVTDYLKTGRNAVGVMLGNGWYSSDGEESPGREPYGDRPKLILQMNIEFTDGESVSIVTDDTWKTSSGPITANDICKGEVYDARLERPGWKRSNYDDSDWDKAEIVEPPCGVLTSQLIPPIKVMKTIKPVEIMEPEENVYIYDFGQNFTGWTKLRVSGPRGARVTLRHAGRLYNDYRLDARNNSGAEQTDTYILKGEGTEVWEPIFTLHGSRYVEMTGFPGTPTKENLEGCFVRSSVEISGSFTCSNPLINQIHHNVCWTFMSSFQGIPQDAAERCERFGWLGDPGFVAEDYIYNFDTASFWTKWLDDIKDSQKPDGDVPVISPIHLRNIYPEWPAWKSSYPLFVWYVYQYYGDEQILEEHYDSMKKLVDFLSTKADNYIVSCGLGDHMEPQADGTSSFSPKHTPASLTSTAYYYDDAWILSQAADILGKANDAKYYSDLAKNIKDAFNREFFDEDINQYATGSQTSNALPLYLSIVPEGREKDVAKNLVDDIMITHNGHLSTGIIGANALEQALPESGWANVMYEIATQTTFPSWGYQVLKGATTIWEAFEYCPWCSLNMKMFGSVEMFFYKTLAGISPASVGYKQIAIKPHALGDLKNVIASVKTVRGEVKSSWVRDGDALRLDVTIPVNSQAKVSVPKMGLENVTIKESGKIIFQNGLYVGGVSGIIDGGESAKFVTLDVESGSYSFELSSRTPKKPPIEYSNLEAPESVEPDESFEVSAMVKNLSEYNLLKEIQLTYGRIVDWKVIPLVSGESRKVTFTIKLHEAGDYGVSIGSLPSKNVHVEPA